MIYDNIQTISKTYDFSGLNREAHLFFPALGQNKINDLKFSFYIRPSYILASGPQHLGGGENYHFYFNGTDITPGIKKCLIRHLTAVDKSKLKEQYLMGAKSYYDYVMYFGVYNEQYKDEFEVAKQYINTIDIAKTLEELGSRKVGISGNLHILNFMYRFISIPCLSMVDVCKEAGLDFEQMIKNRDLVIQMSQGPSPTLFANEIGSYIPAGSLEFHLNVQTVNPLEKPLKDIFTRLTELQKQLDGQRTTYLNPLYDVTNKIEKDLAMSSDRILLELKQIETNINNI